MTAINRPPPLTPQQKRERIIELNDKLLGTKTGPDRLATINALNEQGLRSELTRLTAQWYWKRVRLGEIEHPRRGADKVKRKSPVKKAPKPSPAPGSAKLRETANRGPDPQIRQRYLVLGCLAFREPQTKEWIQEQTGLAPGEVAIQLKALHALKLARYHQGLWSLIGSVKPAEGISEKTAKPEVSVKPSITPASPDTAFGLRMLAAIVGIDVAEDPRDAFVAIAKAMCAGTAD